MSGKPFQGLPCGRVPWAGFQVQTIVSRRDFREIELAYAYIRRVVGADGRGWPLDSKFALRR